MSAVIALANPRRIKASHRRRRRVASDHLLYILNNPLSGTDPTGYLACIGQSLCIEGGQDELGGRRSGGCNKFDCRYALGGDKNGAKKGAGATPEKRNESNSGVSGKLSDMGSAVKNGLFGPIIEYGERGKPGDLGDHALNGAKWAGNALIDTADALFQFEAHRTPGGAASFVGPVISAMPRFEYSDKGLKTPAVLQGTSLLAGGLKSAAGIAGRMRGVGKVAEEVAESGAPSVRQAGAGDGPQQMARNVNPKTLIGRQGRDEISGSQVSRMTKDMKANGYDARHPIDAANVDGKLVILDGHHRAQAASKAGIKEVPVNVHSVTRQQGDQLMREAAEARSRN